MERMYQIVAILVRVAAIFVLLRAIAFSVSQIGWIFTEESIKPIMLVLFGIFVIIPVFIAGVMWKFPLTIAYKVVPEIREDSRLSDLPIDQIQIAALSVLGVFIIVSSLPDLLYWYTYFQQIDEESFGNKIDAGGYAAIYKTVLELVLGLWLMFGGRGVVGIINIVRYAGTRK